MNGYFVESMPNDAYHLLKDRLSSSAFKALDKSPAHYRHWLTRDDKPTQALLEGRMIHAYILEPEVYANEYMEVYERLDLRTKDGKAKAAEIKESGKEMVSLGQVEMLLNMRNAVAKHELASSLLASGKPEVSFFWQDTDEKLPCRARADWWDGDRGIIVDLKSTRSASPADFQRQAIDLGYHLQASLYRDGISEVVGKQHDFYFIAVEKEPPYGVAVYKATEPLLRYGQVVYKNLLNTYKNCKASGSWPCYSAEVIDLDLPSYMYKK